MPIDTTSLLGTSMVANVSLIMLMTPQQLPFTAVICNSLGTFQLGFVVHYSDC